MRRIQTSVSPCCRRGAWICALAALLVAMGPGAARAAPAPGLYEAAIPVTGQDVAQRHAAIRQALGEVLVKVTGNRSVMVRPEVTEALGKAATYVEQYRYRIPTQPARASAEEDPGLLLVVSFNASAVNRMLTDNDLPVWSRLRPTPLLWLAVQSQGNRYLLGAEQESDLTRVVQEAAAGRGIAILLPLMDIRDYQQLAFSDVWGNFAQAILGASRRYGAEVVLVGRVSRSTGRWRGRWTLYQGGNPAEWETVAASEAAVVEQGIDGAVDVLASRYAPLAGDSTTANLIVAVSDVHDLKSYVRLSRYLSSLTPVVATNPVRAAAGELVFELRIRGAEHTLLQEIALGNTLSPVESGADQADLAAKVFPGAGVGQVPLRYRLNP